MRIRNPSPSEKPAAGPAPASVRFRVPTGVVAAKFAVASALAVLAVTVGEREQTLVGLVTAAAVAVYATRDVLARERLTADRDGVVAVSGYAGHARLPWVDVERMTVHSRLRLGARTETLELDAGEHVFIFSRYDLGVPPEEALTALEAVRDR